MFDLSIIIPIFEESKNVEKLVNEITNNLQIDNYEILFVDDNSNDGTEEILNRLSKNNNKIKCIIRKEKTKDLSKSCILGFEKSLYENILVMDGDLQHDTNDINKLIQSFNNDKADIVVGSRNLFNKKNEGLDIVRLIASKILIIFVSLFLGKKTDDPMSGFFIFKKKIYELNKKKLHIKGYKILLDLIYCSDEKLKIIDVDINFKRRSLGSSKMGFRIIYILVLQIIKKIFQ
jgi:dolichol-phosphate mannosyltransferase|tara:strand:+ start:215 stop:913 length:699 start_codon:yes stop_codon:yes gene_type:complete